LEKSSRKKVQHTSCGSLADELRGIASQSLGSLGVAGLTMLHFMEN